MSAVIPMYNAEGYIGRAIASALGQTLADVHVVVVDDGSTDGSLAAARQVRDARLTIVSTPNQGCPRARNAGCAAAPPSTYIAFLDADDEWDAGKLEAQVGYLDRRPDVVAVGCLMRYISSAGRALGGATGQEVRDTDQHSLARGELTPFMISSLVARRAAFDEVGGFDESFPPEGAGAEDLDLIARLAGLGRVMCVPDVLGSYRIHPASALATTRSRTNTEARFVRRRLAARAAGGDLTWDEFSRTYRPSWGERRQDKVDALYRWGAVWYAEGRIVRSLAHLAVAAALGPRYTLSRLYRQRISRRR